MNPYSVDCETCDTIATDLGFEAAIGHALEHTGEHATHTCQIATAEKIVLTGEVAEGNR
mgnify:CR=1 FL=1